MLERELPPLFNAMQGGCCYAFCGCFSQEAPQIEKDYQAAVAAVLDTAWRQIEDVFVGASQGGYGGVLWTVAEEGVASEDQMYHAKMRAKEVAQTRALLVSGHMHHGNGIGDNRGFVQPRDVGVGPGVVSATGQRYLCIVKLEKTAKSDLAMEAAATPEPALATPSYTPHHKELR